MPSGKTTWDITNPKKIKRWTILVTGAFVVMFLLSFRTPTYPTRFNLVDFGRIPVQNGGRTKPLDSIARNSLLSISGKQTLYSDGEKKSALEWLVEVLFQSELADKYAIFEIDDPDVLGLMNMQQTNQRRTSFTDLQPFLTEIENQAANADKEKAEHRNRFQAAVLILQSRLILYQKLKNSLQFEGEKNVHQLLMYVEGPMNEVIHAHGKPDNSKSSYLPTLKQVTSFVQRYQFVASFSEFFALPVQTMLGQPPKWISYGEGLLQRFSHSEYHPGMWAYADMGDAFRTGNAKAFNEAVLTYENFLALYFPKQDQMSRSEYLFNQVNPFQQSMVLYLVVFLLSVISWLVLPTFLNRIAFPLLGLSFLIHTGGLLTRMLLHNRPPVTNLYSSAIFVGWVSVLLGFLLERMFRRGIGAAVASFVGFVTLIIAHHLASQGDTLEMMRAVLDSNFWLATHVVSITIGYGSTFVSGVIGIIYVVRRLSDPKWTPESGQLLERMIYGVVCFSTFFSFLGTILGGIWADQSWGRFWGWDPKENGALMIVLWNVFILHARWGKLFTERGIVVLAVFGNIVTALSWFGVNMLGIGLHSYGFMDKAFLWLVIFIASQLLIIGLGFLRSPGKKPPNSP